MEHLLPEPRGSAPACAGYEVDVSEKDPHELADRYEQEAGELERRNKDLAQEVREVGADWERKRGDDEVPGAQPPQPGERTDQEASSEDDEAEERSGGGSEEQRDSSGQEEEDRADESPAGGEGAPS
jgi:hypothetical protein